MSTGKWIGSIASAAAAVGIILWGVPYYIKHQVEVEVRAEMAEIGTPAPPAEISQNTATIEAVQSQLSSMEQRMIERDRIQAERDAVIMQFFADKASD